MNSLQTTLTALEAQLESQKAECIAYEKNTYEKQLESLRDKVSNFFREVVGIITPIRFNGTHIAILAKERSNIEIYYELPWKNERDSKPGFVELSWYGSRCKSTELEDINYLKLLGHVASYLAVIEWEWHSWYEEYAKYNSAKRVYYTAISSTERAIQDTKDLIAQNQIREYKKVGFKCDLKPRIICKRNWDIDRGQIGDYTLVEESAALRIHYGYGKWNYIDIESFEILKELKRGKMLVSVKLSGRAISTEYELTPKFFDHIVSDVFSWQTSDADAISLGAYKEFDQRATKQVTQIAE